MSHDNMNHSSLGLYVYLLMTLTVTCNTRRYSLLSDRYYLQVPALCQYSRKQIHIDSIQFNESQMGPTLPCESRLRYIVGFVTGNCPPGRMYSLKVKAHIVHRLCCAHYIIFFLLLQSLASSGQLFISMIMGRDAV